MLHTKHDSIENSPNRLPYIPFNVTGSSSKNSEVPHDVCKYLTMFFTLVTELSYCLVTVRRNETLITVVHHTMRSTVNNRAVKML